MAAMDDLRGPKAKWSVRLMQRLYDERPRFCDVAIECIPARHADGREDTPEQNVVYAHRAVLAARTSCVPQNNRSALAQCHELRHLIQPLELSNVRVVSLCQDIAILLASAGLTPAVA